MPLTQRKTGLFKKAYELGVLCSVDVAVIIFGASSLVLTRIFILTPLPERKPGHPDKLFQYCSTDINTLVQRQVRVRTLLSLIPSSLLIVHSPQFDGERDLRTPQDFSGGAGASRMDDMGDDDDDGDADDSPSQYLRHDSLKAKSEPDSSQVAGQKLDTAEVRSTTRFPPSARSPASSLSSTTAPTSTSRVHYSLHHRLFVCLLIVIPGLTHQAVVPSVHRHRTLRNLQFRESVSRWMTIPIL